MESVRYGRFESVRYGVVFLMLKCVLVEGKNLLKIEYVVFGSCVLFLFTTDFALLCVCCSRPTSPSNGRLAGTGKGKLKCN